MDTVAPPNNRISALHVVIVVLSLGMTFGAWLYSKRQVEIQIENRFEAAAGAVIALINDRMSRYEDALWSGVAHMRALDGRVTHEGWKTFANSLRIEEKYPGVNGIGVIYYLDRADVGAFAAERATEARDFSIFPEHDEPFRLPITFIEPETLNAAAVGLDVAHETNRREGLLASRDTGTAQITGPIVLVQDNGHTPGFLFYTPFYAGDTPGTVAERRERFVGVVYAPFIVRNLVQGLLAKELRNVRFSLSDGDSLIYDEHGEADASRDPEPLFSRTTEIELYGRTWVVDIRSDLDFRAENTTDQPLMILLAGLIIEILVIALVVLLARSNHKIHAHAHRLTSELRNKTSSLEKANAEIEQFVYVASHDLKTPARGIGLLTDMLEEDLEDAMGPLPPNSEIREHMKLIRERVHRMNALTEGIMAFSRVGQQEPAPVEAVAVRNILNDCIADFTVRSDQIRLETEVESIAADPDTFRRVMENLVGNAFKYHPDRPRATVTVRIDDEGDRLRVCVSDDGAGIAPEFHDKVFDVFQTLRAPTDPDSTGIGLAIVRKAVRSHGFDIRLDSEPGQGARFTFHWPKASGDVPPTLEQVA